MTDPVANPPGTPEEAPPSSPVTGEAEREGALEEGWALCLSGGGYRAMLFHLGALWRLNELGFLPRLARISSVSGGSITAGLLGLRWPTLDFDAAGVGRTFQDRVVAPLRALAGETIDTRSVFTGVFTPGSIAEKVANAYRRRLFGDATLQDLPDRPRFVLNATNVQTGALFRFSKPYLGDYRIGRVFEPRLALATAVAASSAFPPVLSPLTVRFPAGAFKPDPTAPLGKPPFTTTVVLTDGGVYDNLGLETVWKRYTGVLVSDGGGKLQPEGDPAANAVQHSIRVNGIIDNQVRSLRKRQVIAAFCSKVPELRRDGTYWGIRTDIAKYGLGVGPLSAPKEKTLKLAETPTRLAEMPGDLQEKLINWGYAVCDAAMRRHVLTDAPRPGRFPYPSVGVG
jgi:NTE family protein